MDWILWIDIETDGLDPNKNNILQIACVLSNFNLRIQHFLQEYTIKYSESELNLSDWCKEQHTKSGLLTNVYNSQFSIKEVEKIILNFINCYVGVKDTLYIAGNSVHFDKSFIDIHMPYLSKRLNRRIIDISSISILCKNLCNDTYKNKPKKVNNHTSLSDIQESINEYNYYLENFIKKE